MRLYDIDKLKAEIEARFNDNLEAEEKSGAGIFGAAAKEDYDILALIENMDELNDEETEENKEQDLEDTPGDC